ncbi:MAG: hypothetical protein OXQ90_12925 [Gammaproteobacteria bacterium]|nr:hypothetical protein [Gammaproteobacteria bacterium]
MRASERGRIIIPKTLRDLFGMSRNVAVQVTPIRRGPLIQSIPLIGAMLLSACQTFENPLNWGESPMAGQLVGTWRAAEGEDRVRVSRTDNGPLRFEEASCDDSDPPDTFIADLLASGSVHVLQVRMDTFSEDGRRPEGTGFGFLRVTQGAEDSVLVQGIDVDLFSRVAEEELRESKMQMQAKTVAECAGEKLGVALWAKFWNELSEPLAIDLQAQILSALDYKTLGDVAGPLAELAELEIDPYAELAKMRTCIARHLPSETLGDLLLRHADRVFTEEAERYVRE